MSMKSKVNPTLQNEILGLLTTGVQYSNRALWVRLNDFSSLSAGYSLRKIQEATQKMTRDGLILKSRNYGFTFYGRVHPTTIAYNGIGLTAAA